MHNQNMLHHTVWKPFALFGLSGKFWDLQADTLISTWVILILIALASVYVFYCLKNPKSLVRWCVLQYVQVFRDLLLQSLKTCPINHLAMIGSFFTFITLCNTIQIIPWLEEPTKDLNTTFALGLTSFLYVHFNSIKAKGLLHYIAHYFEPFFIMFPLHIIGAISSIISLSFRLFGNIYGGFIISSLYSKVLSGSVIAQTVGIISGANIIMLLLFGIFEGLIQAFVFTMLTMTYLSMELTSEDEVGIP
ncbi:F0F1 ATP synthase subunit A [Candidatus Babeliales bacterium]|nr:F0F1 ATP synthase subunit A [Candidatus Babeliales bacterium]